MPPSIQKTEFERDTTRIPLYVEQEEAKEILVRRKVMFPKREKEREEAESRVREVNDSQESEKDIGTDLVHDTVGLTLSGGGVRSASFNLGLLDSFIDKGLIRWVDYLSTVSGGGFIGTYLSTLLCHQRTEKLSKELKLAPEVGDDNPEPETRFIRGGSYLRDGVQLADRFLIGFILNGVVWVSLLVFVTASLAYAWCGLEILLLLPIDVNDTERRNHLKTWIPFAPFLLVTTVWLLSWVKTYLFDYRFPRFGAPRVFGKWVFKLAMFTLVVGATVRFGTHDLFKDQQLLILGVVALLLLPYLHPTKLLRSELRAPSKIESTLMRFSGGVLLAFVPTVLIYVLVHNPPELFGRWEPQESRLRVMGVSLLTFIIVGYILDLNATSLQSFYRKKLHDAYVVRGVKDDLKDLSTVEKGGPYHFICATLNFFDDWPWKMTEYTSAYTFLFSRRFCGSQSLDGKTHDEQVHKHGYIRTEHYIGGNLDVATAAAISGAAFSPAIIRNPLLFCMSILLNLRLGQWMSNPRKYEGDILLRVRQAKEELGENGIKPPKRYFAREIFYRAQATRIHKHLRRGGHYLTHREVLSAVREIHSSGERVNVLTLARDFMFPTPPRDWKQCFVTDGGHNDNLGIAPIIFRRSRLIIISDATMDGDYRFDDFLKAYRRYRTRGKMFFCRIENEEELGQLEPIDLTPLRPQAQESHERTTMSRKHSDRKWKRGQVERSETKHTRHLADRSDQHFLLWKLTYPTKEHEADPDHAIVVYIKPTMTGDEPSDLQQYSDKHPNFPHDPTTDQFYSDEQVESYRELGRHIGDQLCDTVLRGRDLTLGTKPDLKDLWEEPIRDEDTKARNPDDDQAKHQHVVRDLQDYATEDLIYMLLSGYLNKAIVPKKEIEKREDVGRALTSQMQRLARLLPSQTDNQRKATLLILALGKAAPKLQNLLGKKTRLSFVYPESDPQGSLRYKTWKSKDETVVPGGSNTIARDVLLKGTPRVDLVTASEAGEEYSDGPDIPVAAYPCRLNGNVVAVIQVSSYQQIDHKKLLEELASHARACETAIELAQELAEESVPERTRTETKS